MAVVRELVCDCGAILVARHEADDATPARCPVCGNLADVEHSSDLAGALGSYDPDGPAVQVVIAPHAQAE